MRRSRSRGCCSEGAILCRLLVAHPLAAARLARRIRGGARRRGSWWDRDCHPERRRGRRTIPTRANAYARQRALTPAPQARVRPQPQARAQRPRKETVLYSFGRSADGQDPDGNLINVNDTLSGTTNVGGSVYCPSSPSSYFGCGSVFVLRPREVKI